MFKTGNALLDLLSGITLLFPLLPVVFVFIKSLQGSHEVFPLLIVVCLSEFLKNIFLSDVLPGQSNLQFFILFLSLVQLICLVLLFRVRYAMHLRNLALLILVASVSILLTCYLLKGFESFANLGSILISTLIVLYSLFTLVDFFTAKDLYLPGEPGFWVAAGSFFYWGIQLLVLLLREMKNLPLVLENSEVVFLADLSSCIQFSMYCCAVIFFAQKTTRENEG